MEDSPLTDTTPGAGKGVEHSEHVGMKLLAMISVLSQYAPHVRNYQGNKSTTVHPSRSRYPARMELACIISFR